MSVFEIFSCAPVRILVVVGLFHYIFLEEKLIELLRLLSLAQLEFELSCTSKMLIIFEDSERAVQQIRGLVL